ncbi:sel1 repeat family protein [Streptomyces sp. Inha503]|uniref:sel1 repeat family protein n=1 Tax=Streptomyces sp. Inha503 TaxID=3383314 RepID=UPI0039A0156B
MVRAAYDEGRPIPESLARKAAEAGDPRGMTVYGIGLGQRGAYAEAVHWLGKAAGTGDLSAMVVLGTVHLDRGELGEDGAALPAGGRPRPRRRAPRPPADARPAQRQRPLSGH